MNNWKDFRRILIEETIRLMALEVVIGLTPIGIADAMGVELQLLYRVASISLSIPVVIWVVMIVIRTRKKDSLADGQKRLDCFGDWHDTNTISGSVFQRKRIAY